MKSLKRRNTNGVAFWITYGIVMAATLGVSGYIAYLIILALRKYIGV